MSRERSIANKSPAEIADRIEKRIAEAIDRELYHPLKSEFDRASHVSRLGFLKEQLKGSIEKIINEELPGNAGSGMVRVDELLQVRNALFDSVPVGDVKAFDLIKLIRAHLKTLDTLIDKYGKRPSVPLTISAGSPTTYRLLLELSENLANPLDITEMFIPGTRMFIHDSRMHDHDARILDIVIIE